MINLGIRDCEDCTTIKSLIEDVDCKITELGKVLYNNTIFALNKPVQGSMFLDLINYKRILTYRLNNPDYASTYTTDMIASKIKILKYK